MTTRVAIVKIALGLCFLASGCGDSAETRVGDPKKDPERKTVQDRGQFLGYARGGSKELSQKRQNHGSVVEKAPTDVENSRVVRERGDPLIRLPIEGAHSRSKDEKLPEEKRAEQGRLILPMPLPKLGKWLVKGKDAKGTHWEATLVFTKNIDERKNAGYFDWNAIGSSGREHFYGIYDPKTKIIQWRGYRIEKPVGRIIHANYEAEVSADKLRLTNGKWSGNGSIPGTWSAEWKATVK